MYRLNISITLSPDYSNPGNASGSLQLSENFSFEARNFLEMASVLGKFHEMAEQLGDKKESQ